MKRLAGAFVVFSMALTGCGGSLCDDLDDHFKQFSDKTKACSSLYEPYTEPTDAEFEQCEQDVKSCTDAEKDSIGKFLDCANGLADCTAATEQQFATSYVGCAQTHLSNISDTCLSSTSESIRHAASMNYSR